MLHLITRNKAGRNFNNENDINWKAEFKASEDSFTSSIFGHLFYLPVTVFWQILKNAIYDLPAIVPPERILFYHFWPSWTCNLGNRCEPDLFIRFDEFDLIIEAKRYDHNQQSEVQWKNELESYYNEYGTDRKILLLAVGGIYDLDQTTSLLMVNEQPITILKCRWVRLLQSVRTYRNEILKDRSAEEDAFMNILSDLIISFRIHGFQTGNLFNTMPTHYQLNLIGYQSRLKLTVAKKFQQIPNLYTINNYHKAITKL